MILRFLLPYVMLVFYRERKTVNAQKKFNAQTIFVSNHPSAFIDPLVAGNFQLPVLYFVTRGDIFKRWLAPVTWASHMVPIFRKAEDGVDSHEKNKDSFRYLRKVLMRKKSLILFGEGYTDDTFIRSLKIIKKGPARIGFDTMVECDWQTDIKVQALGLNYTHPKHFRSSVLLSFGECLHLKDYKELYEKSPSAAITKLTRDIQDSLQEQITYVDQKELAPFAEQILVLSRKGMNHFHHNAKIPLEKRYHYSKETAQKINEQYDANDPKWSQLNLDLADYFAQLKKDKINENWVYAFGEQKSKKVSFRLATFLALLPLTLLGLLHQFIPYFIVKRFVEKTFKRSVFWSGVKLLLGAALSAIYNLIFIYLFMVFVYPSGWLALAYYLTIPAFSGVIAYQQINRLKDVMAYRKANLKNLKSLSDRRLALIARLKEMNLI